MSNASKKFDRAMIHALVNSLELPPSLQAQLGERPKQALDHQAIHALVRGIAPVDPVQLRLLLRLSPAERVLAGMRALMFAKAIVRGALRQRFPDLSDTELNLKVLKHFTPICIRRS